MDHAKRKLTQKMAAKDTSNKYNKYIIYQLKQKQANIFYFLLLFVYDYVIVFIQFQGGSVSIIFLA
jgi:DNA repair protein RadC